MTISIVRCDVQVGSVIFIFKTFFEPNCVDDSKTSKETVVSGLIPGPYQHWSYSTKSKCPQNKGFSGKILFLLTPSTEQSFISLNINLRSSDTTSLAWLLQFLNTRNALVVMRRETWQDGSENTNAKMFCRNLVSFSFSLLGFLFYCLPFCYAVHLLLT